MSRQIRDRAGQWHPAGYTLPIAPPLMPHQKHGANWIGAHDRALLCSEPGCGKSAMIIESINRLPPGVRVLILCPASLRANWLKELALWLTAPRRCEIVKRRISEAEILILNYDALAKFEVQIRAVLWDLVVCDEAHAMKNPDGIKAQQVAGGRWTDRLGTRRMILATATPILNRAAELWPLLAILAVPISREEFTERFVERGTNNCRDPEGLRALLMPLMLRQTKAECLNLPPKVRRVVAFEPSGELLNAQRVESDWCREIEKAGCFPGGAPMDKLSELRQKTALAKIAMPAVQEHLRRAVAEDGKLVVMVHHQVAAEAVLALFPGELVAFTGQHSQKQRNEAVERFQQDPGCRVFVGTPAAREGITLTAARRMIFLEGQWSAALIEQPEDRIHRIGQTRPVLIEHIVTTNSVDARQIELQVEKQNMIDGVLKAAT